MSHCHHYISRIVILSVSLLLIGCDRGLGTSYGPSKGVMARRSVNGFTTFRQAFDTAGFSHRDINRLTSRARRMSVLVWTPVYPSGIEIKTTRWLEQWLRMGSKTLVYVVPDSGSESDFYRDARPLASPVQRLEYRRKMAESLVNDHQRQLERTALRSNGWFSVKPKSQRSELQRINQQPPLSEDSENTDSETSQWNDAVAESKPRQWEWVIEAFDRQAAKQSGTPTTTPIAGPAPWGVLYGVSPTTTEVEFQPLLQSQDGDVLVARVTSKRWNGSQILVVAGGSLLTNYGLTQPGNQRLAVQLIDNSLQALVDGGVVDAELHLLTDGAQPQVGFSVASGELPISERNAEIPKSSGAELLTAFPISFVTIHLALLGFVICLMLMPVFGRPRPVNRGVLTHFGDHLDAVAALMRRRGGEAFAKRRISDYMKRVRDETSGPWVMDEPIHRPGPPVKTTAALPSGDQPTISDDTNQPDRG